SLRCRPRRIRRRHHLCLQRPGRDADASAGHLLGPAGARWRGVGAQTRRDLYDGRRRRAHCCRDDPALGAAEARSVSLVMQDAVVTRGAFTLNASLEAPLSGITVVFGPSGAGKSMLLATIAGLNRLSGGHIALGGRVLEDGAARERVPSYQRGVGLVFQDARLFPHLTVRGNLRYAEQRRPA